MQITIYTDGACDIHAANRPGGWAAILVARDSASSLLTETVVSGGSELTTNNQMELQAVIEGLKLLREPTKLSIASDSRYVIDVASGKKNAKANQDLWREYRSLAARHDISWTFIRGHKGHVYNERCDKLAVAEKKKRATPANSGAVDMPARKSDIQIYLSTRYAWAKKLSVWAAVFQRGDKVEELSGRMPGTTEQEAVLLAAIRCLESMPLNASVSLLTAQEYLSKGMNTWTRSWMAMGWKTRAGKPVKYQRHWQALLKLAGEREVDFFFVKSRSDEPHFQRGAKLTAALLHSAK